MRSILFTTAIVSALAALPCSISAQTDQLSELQNLSDQPSRADLFHLILQADENEDPTFKTDETEFFNLYGPFRFPNDALFDVVQNHPRTNAIFGIDISHYTPVSFPLEALQRKSVRFVYAKASQGTSLKDDKFAGFWVRLGTTKLHRGAYHFLSAGQSGTAQAQTFLRVLGAAGALKSTDMPPVVDLEWDKASRDGPDRWAGQSADQIVATVGDWIRTVEKQTGRKPVVYTARAWIREHQGLEPKLSQLLSGYTVWIADYSKSSRATEQPKLPGSVVAPLWQFTDSATLASGWSGAFDANIFYGTDAEFYSAFGVQSF